jgi:hypothetical protein
MCYYTISSNTKFNYRSIMKYIVVWFFSLVIATSIAPQGHGRNNNFFSKLFFGLEASIVTTVLFTGVCALFGDKDSQEIVGGVAESYVKTPTVIVRCDNGYSNIFGDHHDHHTTVVVNNNVATQDSQVSTPFDFSASNPEYHSNCCNDNSISDLIADIFSED